MCAVVIILLAGNNNDEEDKRPGEDWMYEDEDIEKRLY